MPRVSQRQPAKVSEQALLLGLNSHFHGRSSCPTLHRLTAYLTHAVTTRYLSRAKYSAEGLAQHAQRDADVLEVGGLFTSLLAWHVDSWIDAKTAARLRELEAQKVAAVREEDYDEAKRLKLAIDGLRRLTFRLAELEARSVLLQDTEQLMHIMSMTQQCTSSACRRSALHVCTCYELHCASNNGLESVRRWHMKHIALRRHILRKPGTLLLTGSARQWRRRTMTLQRSSNGILSA